MSCTPLALIVAMTLPSALPAQGGQAQKPVTSTPVPTHVHAGQDAQVPTEDSTNRWTLEALAHQIAEVRAATVRYHDVEEARRDGFVLFPGGEAPLMGEHWYRKDRVRDSLDLARPSTLQYATIGGERRLVGVAYTIYQRPDEPLPEGFAGHEDHWHVHDIPMLARAVSARSPILRWLVNRRIDQGRVGAGDGRTQLAMVHAWIWLDNPDGMFALRHRALAYLKAGLPAEWAALPEATEDAARGIMLLESRTCSREVRLADRVTDISRGQSNTLRTECRKSAEAARAAREEVPDDVEAGDVEAAGALNAAAAAAWRAWIAARDATLTAEQLARLEAIVEHAEVPSGQ